MELGDLLSSLGEDDVKKLKEMADYQMHVNIDDMQISEDVHMTFDHMMYRVLRDALESND